MTQDQLHDEAHSEAPRLGMPDDATERMRHRMLTEPTNRLILQLAVPAVVANLVSTIYNLADSYFIGQISTSAEAAVGVSFVVMTLIQAIGFYFGQGTGNALSRYLGAGDRENAQRMASCGLALSFGLGLVLAIVGHLLLGPLCRVAGASDTVLPYAQDYISLILIGAPWMAASHTVNFHLRMEGEVMWSMVAMVVGAVLDFVLDPLFIFVFDLGIRGAALATIICELLSFVMVLVAMQKTGVTRYSLRSVRLDLDLLRENNNGGLPSLARQLVSGVASMAVNHAALPYGDAAVAAMAITVRVASVGNFMQVGIGQGFQPLCGYNYGARRFDRVREGYWFSIRTCSLVVAVISFFTFVFAPQIATLMRNDPDVIAIATVALRFQSVTLPLTSVAMITNFMLQTTGRMWRALFLGLCRLGIVLAPTATILAQLFGLFGIEIAQSVTDLITVAIAIPLSRSALRELH
jgi:putative MATE family efflux protein